MGFAYSGACYQSPAAALDAFVKSVPGVTPSGINTFASQPTISETGEIAYAIINRPLTGDTATTRTGTMQLASCASEGMEQWPVQTIVFVAVLFFAAVLGFRSGFRP